MWSRATIWSWPGSPTVRLGKSTAASQGWATATEAEITPSAKPMRFRSARNAPPPRTRAFATAIHRCFGIEGQLRDRVFRLPPGSASFFPEPRKVWWLA